MRLITQRIKIQSVCKDWLEQYPGCDELGGTISSSIYNRLKKLDLNTCDPKEVDEIIGNKHWTEEVTCFNCNEKKQTVMLDKTDEYGYPVMIICKECLEKALTLFPPPC